MRGPAANDPIKDIWFRLIGRPSCPVTLAPNKVCPKMLVAAGSVRLVEQRNNPCWCSRCAN